MARTNPPRTATPRRSAKPRAMSRGKSRRRGSGAIVLAVVVVTTLAVTALPLCVLFVLGMLPTAAAIVADRHGRHYLARTVGAMNLAGLLPGALRMWGGGINFASLEQVISSPYEWLMIYGCAGAGWLLYFGMPPLVSMLVEADVDETRRRLEARAKALVEEWGDDVTGRRRAD